MRGRVHILMLVLALAACGDDQLVVNAEPQDPPDNGVEMAQRASNRAILAAIEAYKPTWTDSIEHVVILAEGRTEDGARVWVRLVDGAEWEVSVGRDRAVWAVAEASPVRDPSSRGRFNVSPLSGSSTDPVEVARVDNHDRIFGQPYKVFYFVPLEGEHTRRMLWSSNTAEHGIWDTGHAEQLISYGGATWRATLAEVEAWLVCFDRREAYGNNYSGYECETTNATEWYADQLLPVGPDDHQIMAKRIDLTYDVELLERPDDSVATVTIEPSNILLSLTQVKTVTAKAWNRNGQQIPNKVAVWFIDDSAVAKVTKTGSLTASLTARALGSTTLIATIDGVSAQAPVSVHPVNIAVAPSNPTVVIGGTAGLTATVTSVDGTVLSSGTVQWHSSNTNVVAVTSTGPRTATVTGIAVGSANVTAELLGSSSSVPVHVTYPPLTAYISGPRIITSPGMYTWTADVSGGDGNYTYRWDIHYIDVGGGWGWVGSGPWVTFGVDPMDGDFELRLTVTSAGMSVIEFASVINSMGCPPPQIICE